MTEQNKNLPQFTEFREIEAYVARESLEAHGRSILGVDTEFELLESVESRFSGILVAKVKIRETEDFPLVFGVISQEGYPWIALQSLPTGRWEFLRRKELLKLSGIELK